MTGGIDSLTDLLVTMKDAIAYVCEVEVESISDHDTLESLGIDSLVASQVIIETEIRLGVELSVEMLETLDPTMTIAAVAAELSRGSISAETPRPPVVDGEPVLSPDIAAE